MELQFITHFTEKYSYFDAARLALEGGCRWIQLRMKEASETEVEAEAIRVRDLCRKYGATFIIDDHVALAKKVQADGVHLGKNDMPIEEARRILGDAFIIGGTANTFEDVKRHWQAGANYIGCGPFRFTTTKKNLSPQALRTFHTLPPAGRQSLPVMHSHQMKAAGITLPVVAIGGITYEDIPDILQTGVSGIALSGSILRAENPVEEVRRILSLG